MSPIDRLRAILARLRDPAEGCPWDLEQTFASIAPYTIEEAYEVADAIRREAWDELREELGDLLLQVVYHAQIASEMGRFELDDVARAIGDKLIRRHPHVFGAADRARTAEEQHRAWEEIKAAERAARSDGPPSAFDDVALALPSLRRAQKLVRRAQSAGLDHEPHAALLGALERVLGDLDGPLAVRCLAVMARTCARLGVDAETALADENAAFEAHARRLEHASSRDA